MKIFITGHFAAGTHILAEFLAKKNHIKYLDEGIIQGSNFNLIKQIKYKDYVLQCPRLFYLTGELKRIGIVVWAIRDKVTLVQTQKLMKIPEVSFKQMKLLKNKFPADPIWQGLSYDGSEDVEDGFVKHLSLLYNVKEYFRQNYWPDIKVYKLEEMSYYDETKPKAFKRPMKAHLEAKLC